MAKVAGLDCGVSEGEEDAGVRTGSLLEDGFDDGLAVRLFIEE